MQKRVLPSTEVSLASKAFEKFFAAQEFEDIVEHYKDFTSILQINAGPLAQFYPVLKVSLCTHFWRLISYYLIWNGLIILYKHLYSFQNNIRSTCAINLFQVLDKKISHDSYYSQNACPNLGVSIHMKLMILWLYFGK